LGGAINESTKNQLKCRAIVGAANNQLENSTLGEWLIKNNIVYSPDYLVNSGGVIAIASEINKTENLLEKQLEKLVID
jgi:leucine dehydrogenase